MPRYPVRLLAGTALVAAGVASANLAAAQAFQPTPPYWGGVYLGAHGGYGWGKNKAAESGGGYNGSTGWGYRTEGLLGGVRLGYDWESTGLILGVETGLGYLAVKGDGADPVSGGLDTVSVLASGPYAELTGRIGFADDRWLYYMAGGAVFADLDLSMTDSCTVGPCSVTTVNATSGDIETGWTAGVGIGHALSQNWNATLEYRYMRFEDVAVTDATFSWEHALTIHGVTAGLAFRF